MEESSQQSAAESPECILESIKTTYVPFLKKLISHLEKIKEGHPKKDKLKYVYETFLEADSQEKIKVFLACKDMLDKWYSRYKNKKTQNSNKKSGFNDGPSEDSQPDSAICNQKDSNENKKSSLAITSVVSCSNSTKKSSADKKDGMYVQDEIEIESSNSSTSCSATPGTEYKTKFPVVNIKQEKEENSTQLKTKPLSVVAPLSNTSYQAVSKPSTPVVTQPVAPASDGNGQKEVTFVCASCQFRTTVEADFMKHARTDHRTDLSLWCKKCGKCFSNAGVLVSHIKEDSCEREEMIYRCGVKDCTFETPSGQTFVHHLRHCHKGSPFIFCIHCQKIFTLPHCLILHMQNECPFKEKNRRDPNSVTKTASAPAKPAAAPASSAPVVAQSPIVRQAQNQLAKLAPKPPAPVTPRMATPASQPSTSSVRGRNMASRSRGRGRVRAGRSKFSDSSDSEDPDDPSWKPDENTNNQPLRRSARWAKKVSDAKDPELYDADSGGNKQKHISEQPGKTFFYCPCCDFSALFKSLLFDHYITDHKHQKRISCLVCNVKFENKQSFLEHFSIHQKEKDEGKNPKNAVAESEEMSKKDDAPLAVPMEVVPQLNSNHAEKINAEIKIPYQTAIQEKLQKESKLKSFEDLKSADDITKMKTETKLQHFYKCVIYNCTYTTDDNAFYLKHLLERHRDKKLHCAYCLDDFSNATVMAEHMLKDHGKRFYQCSLCFYRASSKPHVQIHMKNFHPSEKIQYYKCSQHLPPNYNFEKDPEDTDLTTTWPYVCAIGDCSYKTHDPKDFKKHNDLSHRSVTVFFCHYCKVDFISFKRLMSHYHLHGINNYQCTYCVHGSETKEEILLHLCNAHADKSLKVHVRAAQETTNRKSFDKETNDVKADDKPLSIPLQVEEYKDRKFMYPLEIGSLEVEVFCKVGFCGELLENLHCYLKHLIREHDALNHLCPYCSYVADTISDFENHLLCHGPNLFGCVQENCFWHSHKESEVSQHMIERHQLDNVKALVIRQNLEQAVPLLNLMTESLPKILPGQSGYLCPLCYYKCPDRGCMKNHIYQEVIYKRFQCNLCKVKCCSRASTMQHFNTTHSHHNIKCTIDSNADIECVVSYLLTSQVQKFLFQSIHKENTNWRVFSGLPTSKCDNCQVHFPTVRDLHLHQLLCLSQGYEPYICQHCETKTMDLVGMKVHSATAHVGNSVSYSMFPNRLLEEQKSRKLQVIRLGFLKNIVFSVMDKNCLVKPKLIPKHYKCAYCKFVDNFRSNIAKHCLGCHKDKDVNVEKIKTSSSLDNLESSPVAEATVDESSRESYEPMDTSCNESYHCVYCTKKMLTLVELEKHVEKNHGLTIPSNGIYPFFFCPDPDSEYSADDSELYECAYCSVSQENLFHLKRHCNNLHSAAAFQVRGHKTKDGDMITCKYCECKVMNRELLTKHCRFTHPGKPVKAVNDPCVNKVAVKRKRADDSNASDSKKRPKNTIVVFKCSYCSMEADTLVKITSHHETTHPKLALDYQDAIKEVDDLGSLNDVKLFYCTFCSFIGDQELLRKHVGSKHVGCVCCGHCNKFFDSTETLSVHTATEHNGFAVKQINLPTQEESSNFSPNKNKPSNSGVKKASDDLNNLTVNIRHEETSVNAKLPLVYLTKIFPMFPKVILKDCTKDNVP